MTAGIYTLGGFSTVIENLANQLSKRGINVVVGAFIFKHVPHKGLCNFSLLPIRNISKLKRFLKKFDIIHSHHPVTNYLSLLNSRPFIYHFHGAPCSGRESLYKLTLLSSVKMTKHRFDAVIAVSQSAAMEFRQLFNLHNVYVLYNGVDTNRFKPSLEEKYRKGIPQFLFVGNLYRHKNVEELIFAMKRIIDKYPESYLQIVGNGRLYNHLKHLIYRLRLQNNIELTGYVPLDKLPYYYASCDVYVTASRWELFGLPLLEAMACGKPIVASSIQPHIELLTKSDAGAIYTIGDITDLVKKMLRAFEEADRYKYNAVAFAKAHDWSIVVKKLLKIYKKLLENNSNE